MLPVRSTVLSGLLNRFVTPDCKVAINRAPSNALAMPLVRLALLISIANAEIFGKLIPLSVIKKDWPEARTEPVFIPCHLTPAVVVVMPNVAIAARALPPPSIPNPMALAAAISRNLSKPFFIIFFASVVSS